MNFEKKHVGIVLAAGRGSRMKSKIPKQYMALAGKPVLYYALWAMEHSFLDEIILVCGEEDITYCKKEIVEAYGLKKVKKIVAGGTERYLSVYRGLCEIESADYVYIHDGARPLLNRTILQSAKKCVETYHACVAAMPVKDTIKIADADGFAAHTPQRDRVWQVQTPQVFSFEIVKEAYDKLYHAQAALPVTDDAMVVETMLQIPVRLFQASYENIKITTPEDLLIAELFLKKNEKSY